MNNSQRSGGSSSRAGSRVSGSSTVRGGLVLARQQAFLMLLPLERSSERKWIALRLLVEYVQLLGLVANSNFPWDSLIGTSFAYVLYGSTLPFFDQGWVGQSTQTASLVLIWVAIGLLLLTPVAATVSILRDHHYILGGYSVVVSWILHAFGSWLFIPAANACANFLVCNVDRTVLYWHTAYTCNSAVAGVYFAGGVVGLLLLLGTAYVANSLTFEDHWLTGKIAARSRSYLSEATILTRLVLVITYNVLLSQGYPQAFALTGLCLLLVLAAFTAFSQPYYNPGVNDALSGMTFSAALVYAGAVIVAYAPSAQTEGASLALFFVPLVLGLVMGVMLPSIRRTTQLAEDLRVASRGGRVLYTDYVFPAGLPMSDHLFSPYRRIETDILSAAQATRESRVVDRQRRQLERQNNRAQDNASAASASDDDADEAQTTIASPFIDRVYVASDVELAARVLREYFFTLDLRPTDFMVAYALRLFAKGLLLFPQSAALALDFHQFLFSFAFLPRLALSESEAASSKGDMSITNRYRAMKLQIKLKAVLNITDQHHTRTVKAALRAHKEVLVHTALFWSKLMADKVDVLLLAGVVNSITQRRTTAQEHFGKALRFATRSTLLKYARFLDQVMHDAASANVLTQFLADQAAERRATKNSHQQQLQNEGSSQQASSAMMSDVASGLISRIEDNARVSSAGDRSRSISRLSSLMHALFLVLLVVVGLFFAYEGVRITIIGQALDRTSAASDLRFMAAQGGFISNEIISTVDRITEAQIYQNGGQTTGTINEGLIATTPEALQQLMNRLSALQGNLAALASQFSSLQSSVTRGSLESSYAPLVDFMSSDRVESLEESLWIDPPLYTVTDLQNLGNRIGVAMATVASAVFFNTSAVQQAADLLRRNSADHYAAPFNTTVHLHYRSAESWVQALRWGLVGLISAAVLGVFSVYCAMVLNFDSIGAAKLSVIGLFTLIPRVHLEQLHQQARNRIAQFDVDDEQDCEAGLVNRAEDGNVRDRPLTASAAAVDRKPAKMSCVDQTMLASWERNGGALDTVGDDESYSEDGHGGSLVAPGSGPSLSPSAGEGSPPPAAAAASPEAFGTQKSSRTALHFSARVALVLLLMFALSIAAFATAIQAATHTSDLFRLMREERLWLHRDEEQEMHRRRLTDASQAFVLSGTADLAEAYNEAFSEALYYRFERRIVATEPNAALATSEVEVQQWDAIMVLRQLVAVWLAASGYQSGVSTVARIVQHLTYNNSLLQASLQGTFAEFQQPGVVSEEALYPSVDDVSDAMQPQQEKISMAKALVLDEQYEAIFTLIARARGDHKAYARSEINAALEEAETYLPVSIALFAVTLVLALVLGGYLILRRGASGLFLICLGAVSLALAASIGVLASTLSAVHVGHSHYVMLYDQVELNNASRAAAYDMVRYARDFAAFGQQSFYESFDALGGVAPFWVAMVRTLQGPYVVDLSAAQVEGLAKAVSEALAVASRLIWVSTVGVRLAASGYADVGPNASTVAPLFASLERFQYDWALQPIAPFADIAYLSEPRYSSDVLDDALPMSVRVTLAGSVLTNRYFQDLAWSTHETVRAVAQLAVDTLGDSIWSMAGDVDVLVLTIQACTGVVVALLLALVMFGSFIAIERTTTAKRIKLANGDGDGMHSVEAQEDVLFGAMKRQVRTTLAVIATAFMVVFAFDLYVLEVTAAMVSAVDQASAASWNVARSGIISQEALRYELTSNGVATFDAAFPSAARSRLVLMASRLLYNRNALYSSQNWADATGVPQIFGVTDPSSMLQLQPVCELPELLQSASSVFSSELQPNTSYSIPWTANAIDALELQWIRTLTALATSPPLDENSTAAEYAASLAFRDELVRLELATVLGLTNMSSYRISEVRTASSVDSVVHFSLCGATAALLVAVLLFIFRPMLVRILDEDDGTRLLLRMIPRDLRDDVPAIAEYLEHGTITRNEKLQQITEVVSNMSTVAYIVIDQLGTILRVSRAASEEFGHDTAAMIGQNIKMLMPPSIARQHDGFLRRYRDTGIKRVVDTVRRVRAMRRDGSTFPVELLVREFKKNAHESIFLGFIKNVSTLIEFERVTQLHEAVSDMAEVPVIVLDRLGTVFRVNRAATAAFQTSSENMVGRNIKEFMPHEVAELHDDYLARYQRTKEKHIVDSSRRVTALRSTGERFPVQLTVREMCDDAGNTLFFIGYMRDLTSDLLAAQGALANETIVTHSPNPVIAINPVGIVTVFSPAAELSWGYAANEVLGQNIKMLMPVDIAARHDGYLQRYAKTGEKHVVDSTREVKARRKDGSLFPALLNVKEIRRGEQVTLIGYVTDTTNVNQLLEQSRVSKTSLDASPIPIIVTTEDGSIAEFNVAAERLMGYRVEEVINKNVKILVPPEHAERHDEYMERYRRSRQSTVQGLQRPIAAQHKNGQIIECDLLMRECVVPDVTLQSGKRTMYIGFFVETASGRRLERANALNTAICDLCAVPMISIESDGTVLLFNRAAENVFKWNAEEVLNRNIKMLMPARIAERHDGYLQRYAETHEKHVIDTLRVTWGLRKDGVEFPVELKIREVGGKKGVDPLFVGYARDMSEELQLRDAKLATDTVLDRCSVPIVAIDLRGNIVRFSGAAERVFGWSAEDIVHKNVKVLMPFDVARKHDEYLRRYIRTGQRHITAPREVLAMRKDGHVFPVELTLRQTRTGDVSTATEEDGKLRLGDVKVSSEVPLDTLFIGYLKDMSMTHVLRRSNEMRDVILEHASVPMLQITDRGIVTFCNPAAAVEFGWSREELQGQNIKVLMPDHIATQHDRFLQVYRETGIKHIIDNTRRTTGRRRNGEEVPIEVSVREIEVAGSRTFVGYVRNVSEELKVEDMRHMFGVITDLSAVPLVVLNATGVIQLVNVACCVAFGYERHELVGSNVKIIQPDETAKMHDEYLAAYQRNRVKNIVDSTRRVVAKRRSGEQFPVEIMVRELVDSETGESTFVGYLRDITAVVDAETLDVIAKATADLSPVPLIAIDRRGIVLQFSRAATEEFGYDASDVIGHNVKMLMPPSIADQHDGYLRTYLETHQKHVIDTTRRTEARHKNGTVFQVELRIAEVQVSSEGRHDEGIYIGFCRSVEEELRQQRSFLVNRETLDLLPIPFIAITAHGSVDKVNSAALRQFGYTEEELVGKNVKVLMPPDVAAHHDGYLERYRQTRVKVVIDSVRPVRAMCKDGTFFAAEITVKETKDELGNGVFFGFVRDVRQQAAVETEVAIGNAITSMSLVPLLVLDDAGTILRFSDSAETTFGYRRSEVLGCNVKMLMPEPFRKVHDAYLTAYRATRLKRIIGTTRAVPAVRKDGSELIIKLRVSAVEDETGRSTFVGFCEDITPQLRADKETAILQCIHDIAHIAVIVINDMGGIERVSEAVQETFGYREAELLHRNVSMLMPGRFADQHDSYLMQYMRTREKHVIDSTRRFTALHRDGHEFPVDIGVTELVIDGATKFVAFLRDVSTEVHTAEESSFSDAIFTMSMLPIVIADHTGRIVKASTSIVNLFGYEPDQLVGSNLKMLMAPDVAAMHDGYLQRYMSTGVKHVVDTTRVVMGRHRSGRDVQVTITVKELKSSTGATFFVGLIDQPNERQLEREATRQKA